MPTLDMTLKLLAATPGVTWRRLRRGPEQPGWSALYELLLRVVRDSMGDGRTVEEQRQAFDAGGDAERRNRRVTFEEATVAGRPALWSRPPGGTEDVTVLYLHGGAYVIGSPQSHRTMTAPLAVACGHPVVALDYRLAPEHPCPAAIDDAVAAFQELAEDGRRVVIAGDSAGGGLALTTMVALRQAGGPLPAAAVLLSPWTDLARTTAGDDHPSDYITRAWLHERALTYAGAVPLDDPRVSPIGADLTGLPPMLVLAGALETLLSDSERIVGRARAAGVEVELFVEAHEVHVYPMFEQLNPRAAAAHERIADWLERRLGGE